jgi:hypothetical protein
VLEEVVTFSVDDAAPPFTVTGLGLKEHPASSPLSPLQDSVTLPVYPFAGVKVRVEVAAFPAATVAGLSAAALSE